MMTILRAAVLLAALLTATMTVSAQNYVRQDPDCQVFFSFTAGASTSSYDNRSTGCVDWVIAYYNSAFGALSLATQSAPDAAGAPGAWGNFAGTVVTGINPNTSITSAFSVMSGNYPWIRVTVGGLAGGPGTVRGVLYGWKYRPSTAATGAVDLTKVGGVAISLGQKDMAASFPVVIANNQSAVGVNLASVGAAAVTVGQKPMATSIPVTIATDQIQCPSRAVITVAAAGTIEIVPLSGATQIMVCSLSLSFSGATGVQVIQGTGAACVAGPANVTGDYKNVSSMVLGFPGSPLLGSASQALCLTTTGAVTGGGLVTYGYK